jgi:3D (Asp-Asp-Asp) domain-containing protein
MVNLIKQLSTCRLYWSIHDILLKYWWAGSLILIVFWGGIAFLKTPSELRHMDKAFFEDLTASDEFKIKHETVNLINSNDTIVIKASSPQIEKKSETPKKIKTAVDKALEELNNKYPNRKYSYWKTINCKLTAYTPDFRSCGVFSDGLTSQMDNAYRLDGVAACPDVLPYRSGVYIPGFGIKEVDDTGGAMRQAAKKGYYHIDIRMKSNKEAENFGIKWQKVHLFKIAN